MSRWKPYLCRYKYGNIENRETVLDDQIGPNLITRIPKSRDFFHWKQKNAAKGKVRGTPGVSTTGVLFLALRCRVHM